MLNFASCTILNKLYFYILGTADIDCRTCRTIGDMSNLMTCVTCGAHYHGTCVGLKQLPGRVYIKNNHRN